MTCPRLIEVALPIREISAESVRDKNIHHAHISHLHLWWARRPLAACRAVIFASLVPDPDDPYSPLDFRNTVVRLLKTDVPLILKHYGKGRKARTDVDPYRPYDGIADTPRNRLLTFIAKWSQEWLAFEKGENGKQPKPDEMLDARCLVKWETSDPYSQQGRAVLKIARELVLVAHGGNPPTVLDPFAGGGAIPLEAARLGCLAIANDYNPVANLILRATCEFPQKYGRPAKKSAREEQPSNAIVHDVETWANWILSRTRGKIGHLYPPSRNGEKVLAYLWARTVPCSNPSCRAAIPLLRTLLLRSEAADRVALKLDVDKKRRDVSFGIARGDAIKTVEGTKRQRGPALCPICDQTTSEESIRQSGASGQMGERLVAVVIEGSKGKDYRTVHDIDIQALSAANMFQVTIPTEYIVPEINAPNASPGAGSHRSINLELYGFKQWGQLFNHRQLVVLDTLIEGLHEALDTIRNENKDAEYTKAIAIYLAMWIDRVAAFGNTFTRWRPSHEKIETPFGGQSVPMMWDYPEVNPLVSGSGTASTQLAYMVKVVLHESIDGAVAPSPRIILGSAAALPIETSSCECVVTDPPYGNSIAYADLSDFFYVWLKRSLGTILPEVFVTPQTPKEEEATSHKHRHGGSQTVANEHYRKLLRRSFEEAKRVAKDPKVISVMFAHQSTEAWTALIDALLDAGLTATATYPIETEMKSTALALGTASLESSITVVCRPRETGTVVSFRDVRREIERIVGSSVHRFWGYGFRGADLIVACYGPAVSVFGRYGRVERADGTPVTVPELLELAKHSALKAIAGEFTGDPLSRLYFVWANLYGTTEQAWDDARIVVMIGGDSEDAMEVARRRGVFVIQGAKCRLALLRDRADRRHLGDDSAAPLIDQLHHAMQLWKEERRGHLVDYLRDHDLVEHAGFWKLAQALFEVLPRNEEDWRIVNALLSERDTLRKEAKRTAAAERAGVDGILFDR